MKKFIIILITLAIMLGCKEPPKDFKVLKQQYIEFQLSSSPEYVSQLGLPKEMADKYDESILSDASLSAERKLLKSYDYFRKAMENISEADVAREDKIAYRVLKWELENQLENEPFYHYGYIFSHFFNFHSQLVSLFTEYHKLENVQDVKEYLFRLEMVETKLNQINEQIDLRRIKGIKSPKKIMEILRWQLTEFLGDKDIYSNIFYLTLKERIEDLKLTEKDKKKFLSSAELTLLKSIYPAYDKMVNRLSREIENSDENQPIGVWQFENGDEYYAASLKLHITTDQTPEEVHQLGLREIARIQAEMMKKFRELGFEGETYAEIEGKWWHSMNPDNNPDFGFPNTEAGKQAAVDEYMNIIAEAEQELPNFFSLLPKAKVIASRVPEHQSTGAGAFYKVGPFDKSRPGTFFMQMDHPPKRAGMRTLTYHEAIPGHHLQQTIERELEHNRYFNAMFYYTSFIEGWALYAEKFAREQGWHKDVNSELSCLNSELFRATRLALDTGIHYKRWTFEEARSFMQESLGWSSKWELYRYMVWPGQACSYKIGELKILELRERMKNKLGDEFDIKEFHRLVLEDGSMPLEILEAKIDGYLEYH